MALLPRRVVFRRSPEAEEAARLLAEALGLRHVRPDRVYVAVSSGSRSRAYARIWGMPSPFTSIGVCEPAYVIELVRENLAGASCSKLIEVLAHELLHIPRSFSGCLRRHGEWSRPSRIRELVKGLEPGLRRRLCGLLRSALSDATAE